MSTSVLQREQMVGIDYQTYFAASNIYKMMYSSGADNVDILRSVTPKRQDIIDNFSDSLQMNSGSQTCTQSIANTVTRFYCANLINIVNSTVASGLPKSIAFYSYPVNERPFTFNLEEMKLAVESEVVCLPDHINDIDSFEEWLEQF